MLIKYDKNNLLPTFEYYISHELQIALESEKFDVKRSLKRDNFYLIVIRVLNVEKNIFVYNYISYIYNYF